MDSFKGRVSAAHDLVFVENKYQEAEQALRLLVQECEALGEDNDRLDMLDSKHGLAWALHKQQKNHEAQEIFNEVQQGYEKINGKDHSKTLSTKYGLGWALHELQRLDEAMEVFSELSEQRERILGSDHCDTLDSKHGMAWTLFVQKKNQEAQGIFSDTVAGREITLGNDHPRTLNTKFGLAWTLFEQQKYHEAEQVFDQVVSQRERALGMEHFDTLDTKHALGLTLYRLQRNAEAQEILYQAVGGRERTLGSNHDMTLHSKRLLQEILSTSGSPVAINDTVNTLADRLGSFFPRVNGSRPPYNDTEIYQISVLLRQVNNSWSRVPRTYIVLRTIDCLHLLGKVIDGGFSDYLLPAVESSLPAFLPPKMRARFLDAQQLVLTKSMDLEKSGTGRHRHFKANEPLPFESKGLLGAGGFGEVDKVVSTISGIEYARKRVSRHMAGWGRGREALKGIVAEIEILKRLEHQHIVKFVGSYTDANWLGVIMTPVAEMDLSAYLKTAKSPQYIEIQTFFGCLATTLRFLHDSQIRHKDIKPGNILVDRGRPLLTDFGLALDFTDADGSTTVGTVNGMTERYCAPEVALRESRNTSSDVWSLGIVFLEMAVVLTGRPLSWMNDYLKSHGSRHHLVRLNFTGLEELLAELKDPESLSDNGVLTWIQGMLQEDHKIRLTAAELVAAITRPSCDGGGHTAFCGMCCLVPEKGASDTLEDEDFR